MSETFGCCSLPGIICRVLGHLCLDWCARHSRRGNVCGSLVKQSELPLIFNQFYEDKKVRKVSCRILSNVGNMAFIIAVRVKWTNDTSDDYVLKTMDFGRSELALAFHPGRDKLAPVIRQITTGLHNSECSVYEFLKGHSNIKIPKIYYTSPASGNSSGVIIMENLTPRGKMESGSKGLTLEQMQNMVDALARIHLACLKDDSWRNGVADTEKAKQIFFMFYQGMAPMISRAKSFRHLSNLDLKKGAAFVCSDKYLETLYCHRGKLPDVLVHGDMLTNNVMFELLPDGKVGSNVAAIIDWQLARAGNPLDDIAKLVSWGSNPDVYEHHQDTLLKQYFDIMTAESPDQFQITFDELKQIWSQTLAAHNLITPLIIVLLYTFKRNGGGEATKQEKADQIKKCIMAYESAVEKLCPS